MQLLWQTGSDTVVGPKHKASPLTILDEHFSVLKKIDKFRNRCNVFRIIVFQDELVINTFKIVWF